MTVTYTADVATSRGFGCFWKLLFRWRGSIYKLIKYEFLLYCCCYFICSMVYRLALSEPQKRVFEAVVLHIERFINLIPVAFVLGSYVSVIMTRWWDQYLSIPGTDAIAVQVSASIHGQDEEARVMRRTIMRYVNLSFCLTMSMISPPIKKRFPSMQTMVQMGIITEQEKMIFEIMDYKTPQPKYWMPIIWAGLVLSKARKQGRVRDDVAVKTIMDELNNFRKKCLLLISYDTISVPLIYTQVVTLAVYTFFVSTIMGRQFLDPKQGIEGHRVDLYVPVFTLLQFTFYMGWLKVAESLINPFGEDDDDFEVNNNVDKNLVVSYIIVDEIHQLHPELIKDAYFDEKVPSSLPYTVAAAQFKAEPNLGSTKDIKVPPRDQKLLNYVKGKTKAFGQTAVQTVSNFRHDKPTKTEQKVEKTADDIVPAPAVYIPPFETDPETNGKRKRSTFGRMCHRASRSRIRLFNRFRRADSDNQVAHLSEVTISGKYEAKTAGDRKSGSGRSRASESLPMGQLDENPSPKVEGEPPT